jgi:hypothetical protein
VLAGLAGLLCVLTGCGGSTHAATSTTTTSPATTTPTTAAPTTTTTTPHPTTTVFVPPAPQATPDAAAQALVNAWATGDLVLAHQVAAPTAVATLFALPYPAGNLQPRGCTEGVSPGTCTFRNTATEGIYEINVTQRPNGWYVSSVIPET